MSQNQGSQFNQSTGIQNDRRQLLLKEFDNFDANKKQCSMEELLEFLDKQGGKIYDRYIAQQLYEMCKGYDDKINIDDFINVFIETEDTINFRMQLDKSKIEELKRSKEEIKKRNQQDQSLNQQENHILIQVLEATNLSPLTPESSLDSFVKIILGYEVFETAVVTNQKNPIYNESFDFPVKANIKEIKFIVTDRERMQKQLETGSISIPLEELKDQQMHERNDNLIRAIDGLRTRAKLHILIRYIYSQSEINEVEIKKIDEEIKNIEAQYKESQMALLLLKGPFKNLQSHQTNYYPIQKNQYHPNLIIPDDKQIKQQISSISLDNLGYFSIQMKEQIVLQQIEQIVQEQISDWAKAQGIIVLFQGIIVLIIMLSKPGFVDETSLICFLYFTLAGELTQMKMRFFAFFFTISWILDLVWLFIYSTGWTQTPGSIINQITLYSFIIFFCYLAFFNKVILIIITWRNSIKFDNFNESLKFIIKRVYRGRPTIQQNNLY